VTITIATVAGQYYRTATVPAQETAEGCRSIRALALRAQVLCGPSAPSVISFEIWMEEAWRKFVAEVGGIYTRGVEIPLTPGTDVYALPADYRRLQALSRYYVPRSVNLTGNGASSTITASMPHSLSVGQTVTLSGFRVAYYNVAVTVKTVTNDTVFTLDALPGYGENGGTLSGQDVEPVPLVIDDDLAYLSITSGQPDRYHFRDSTHLQVYPVPSTDALTLLAFYDARAPRTLDLDTDLPALDIAEGGLIGYASMKYGLQIGNQALIAGGQADWKQAITDYRKARVAREGRF